ncbi:MAG: response regulator, partial [Candidatus Latescibacteria bacterium]|nr:response regulator [Candidatus Latescibacterota bacterium]
EGLTLYKTNYEKIDIVLLDLSMPKMSGDKLLESIIAINPVAKVIISSGQSHEVLKKYNDAKGYLTKPYHIEDLTSVVRNTIDAA